MSGNDLAITIIFFVAALICVFFVGYFFALKRLDARMLNAQIKFEKEKLKAFKKAEQQRIKSIRIENTKVLNDLFSKIDEEIEKMENDDNNKGV